jgi:hypothetical protein
MATIKKKLHGTTKKRLFKQAHHTETGIKRAAIKSTGKNTNWFSKSIVPKNGC